MICFTPALDYLRLTTYQPETAAQFWQIMEHVSQGEDWQDGRWLQYAGAKWGSGFWGAGIQRGRQHWVMDVAGMLAARVAHETTTRPIFNERCTRLDVQLTIPLPDGYRAREFAEQLRVSEWPWRERIVPLIESGDGSGLDTVYIGSRTSAKLIRIYVKPDGTPEKNHWLRCELELKSDLAMKAWDRYKLSTTGLWENLRGEFANLPAHPIIQLFDAQLSEVEREPLKHEKVVTDDNKTMNWLSKSVTPAVWRMLNGHNTRFAMVRLLNHWLELAQKVERINNENES